MLARFVVLCPPVYKGRIQCMDVDSGRLYPLLICVFFLQACDLHR